MSKTVYSYNHRYGHAEYDVRLTDAEKRQLAKGVSPRLIRPERLLRVISRYSKSDIEKDPGGWPWSDGVME